MHALSKATLQGASLETVVAVAVQHHFGEGYGLWSQENIVPYMRRQRRKTVGGFLGDLVGTDPGLKLGFCVVLLAAGACLPLQTYLPLGHTAVWLTTAVLFVTLVGFGWRGLWLLLQGTSWQTNGLYPDGTYMRNYKRHPLPPEFAGLQATITGLLDKKATLAVSFIGKDPILWVYPAYGELGRIPVLAWDENQDGSITIVSPPRH